MGAEGEYIAFCDRCALDQGVAVVEHLTDRQWSMGLLCAEGGARHTENQPFGCLFTPEARAVVTGVATTDGAGVKASAAVAPGAGFAAGGDALLAVLGDLQDMSPPVVRWCGESFRAKANGPEVVAAAAGVFAQEDYLATTKEEHLKGLAFAGVGLGCSEGFALKLRAAICLKRELGDLFRRRPSQHLETERIVVAVYLPGGEGPWLHAELTGQIDACGAVEVKAEQRAGV